MNLISEQWIPIRRADGSREKIAPWEMTKDINDGHRRIVAIASPRPDFDGALIQFLIGLLQTTCTPPDKMTWRKWRKAPPSADELKVRFETVAFAFELEGDGPRFMQDLTLGPTDFVKKPKKKNIIEQIGEEEAEEGLIPISSLFLEAPGKLTRKQNRDHFVKRDFVDKLCPHCAASALFSLQTNSPGRGTGYRTSFRVKGGGVFSTILLEEDAINSIKSLWSTCWLNVLDATKYLSGKSGNPDRQNVEDKFPWLAKTRTSENDETTTPDDIHPDQQYWAMPQRIRLNSASTNNESCGLCGEDKYKVYYNYYIKNSGINYKGSFRHPLSPYDLIEGHPKPVQTMTGGVGYRHWLGLVENEPNSIRQRAPVLERYFAENKNDAYIWAFGYDIYNNNKIRGWSDSVLPVFYMTDEVREIFIPLIKSMTIIANRVCGLMLNAVFKANFLDPKGKKFKKGGKRFEVIWEYPKPLKKFKKCEDDMEGTVLQHQRALLFSARIFFWEKTEVIFLTTIKELKTRLSDNDPHQECIEFWLQKLKHEAKECFAQYIEVGDFDSCKPRRQSLAQYELGYALKSILCS
ncbi:MAG: type I-E CRISPR-associated protein Cse1/CasA [Candidatus Methylumidiphilus sp.]